MDSTLADIRRANQAGANPPNAGIFVVYDLPDRDCAAAASNGEYSIANGGVANYKAYIDAIKAVVVKYSDIRILLVVGMSAPYTPVHRRTANLTYLCRA
jgi:cellulose 1,4-beta-cellobiosidase